MLILSRGDLMRIDNNEMVGLRISKYRKERNMTQAELAEKIDLSTTEISNIERGRNGLSFNTLVSLCGVFDICSSELLSGAIKESVEDNILDLIRQLDKSECEMLYLLLSTYIDNRNKKSVV